MRLILSKNNRQFLIEEHQLPKEISLGEAVIYKLQNVVIYSFSGKKDKFIRFCHESHYIVLIRFPVKSSLVNVEIGEIYCVEIEMTEEFVDFLDN